MKKIKPLIVALFVFMAFGCEDILEKDISQEIAQNLFPEEGEEILGNTVNFSWEPVEGADYRLQVFKGLRNSRTVLDTLVSSPFYSANLAPSEYRWRIRCENSAYTAPFSEYLNFNVVFSEDLSRQDLILETPSNNLFTNQENLIYTWSGLSAAQGYTFKLQRKTGTGIITVEQISGILQNFYQPATDLYVADAEYLWSVKGENSVSSTDFVSRTFYLDRVLPGNANLISPDDDEKFGVKTINFVWEIPTDVGSIQSAQSSILEISSDIDFANVLSRVEISFASASFTFEENGDYYWRVRVKDRAGNNGPYSLIRSVIID